MFLLYRAHDSGYIVHSIQWWEFNKIIVHSVVKQVNNCLKSYIVIFNVWCLIQCCIHSMMELQYTLSLIHTMCWQSQDFSSVLHYCMLHVNACIVHVFYRVKFWCFSHFFLLFTLSTGLKILVVSCMVLNWKSLAIEVSFLYK